MLGPDQGACQAFPARMGWSSKPKCQDWEMPVLWKEVQPSRGRSQDGVVSLPYAACGVGGRLIWPCLESQLLSPSQRGWEHVPYLLGASVSSFVKWGEKNESHLFFSMTFCRYKERLILLTYWHPETSLLIHREGC